MSILLIKNALLTMQGLPEFTDEQLDDISTYFENHRIRRKKLVLEKEEIADRSYFVVSGCLRMYCEDEQGKEHTMLFATNGQWLTDFDGFVNNNHTCMKIESIIDTEYLTISNEKLDQLTEKYPDVQKYMRSVLQQYIIFLQQKQLNDMQHDAKERYEDFCKVYPNLVGRVKDKHVASYIGVTPEFFSKMLNSKNF